jgi:hypothetical protein
LDTIRLGLGSIAPEEVSSLANERQSLSEEVHRLRDEVHASLTAQAERDRLVEERLHWESELNLSRAERELLVNQLRDLDHDLAASRADNERLRSETRNCRSHGERPVLGILSDETVDEADRSETAVATSAGAHESATTELEELRVQLAEITQRLEHAEDLNREMAAMLRGMGIRWQPTWA